jgi:CBS domain-containing protein
MQASDVMTTDVETVAPDDDVGEVLTRHGKAEFSGFPVVDEEGVVVGVVTEHDLVGLFQPGDRTLWIPVGFPPFLETLTYAVDLSWDELDLGLDIARNAGKPVRTVMTGDVITVGPTEGLDRLADLLTDEERDVNRLPVVEDDRLVGIVTREDVLRGYRDR